MCPHTYSCVASYPDLLNFSEQGQGTRLIAVLVSSVKSTTELTSMKTIPYAQNLALGILLKIMNFVYKKRAWPHCKPLSCPKGTSEVGQLAAFVDQ